MDLDEPPMWKSRAVPTSTPVIVGLDHLVLTVASIPNTIAFYRQVLGFSAREFKPGRFSLQFADQKINLHEVGTVVDPNVRHATPGSADLCFRTTTDLDLVVEHLQSCGVDIIQGPVAATGARAPLRSIYFHDLDENLIEVSNELDVPD